MVERLKQLTSRRPPTPPSRELRAPKRARSPERPLPASSVKQEQPDAIRTNMIQLPLDSPAAKKLKMEDDLRHQAEVEEILEQSRVLDQRLRALGQAAYVSFCSNLNVTTYP